MIGSGGIFRQKSLDRLASPEKLDQALDVVRLRDWIPLAGLGTLVCAVGLWSVFGHIPVNVISRGALVDRHVAHGAHAIVQDVPAPGAGRLISFTPQRGSRVTKGQVLGHIDLPELNHRLQTERRRLAVMKQRQQKTRPLYAERNALSDRAIGLQRQALNESLRQARALGPLLRDRQLRSLRQQRQAQQDRLRDATDMVNTLKASLAKQQPLREKGLIADSAWLAAQRDYVAALQQEAEIKTQQRELDVQEAEVLKAYQENDARIADLTAQLKDLDVKARGTDLDALEDGMNRSEEILAQERMVASLASDIESQSCIVAPADGTLLEIAAVIGQYLTLSQRVAQVKLDEGADKGGLTAVAYFSIGDGRRISPGMPVQITPDSVKREEFGGLVGKVRSVSPFLVTLEGAANVLNSLTEAQALTANDHQIEVFMDLFPDPASHTGYRWTSSRGPATALGPGLTTTVRVAVEERAPITFVMPFLRRLLGGG